MKVKETLKRGFQLLHNSPAKCEDCESVSGSTKYPYKNKLVAERMIEMWPNLIKLTSFWTSLPKSKQHTCKSYGSVCDAVQDLFVISKLTFFSFVKMLK